jgi:L-rhamnose isomerase/sugar isomerase
MIDQSHNLKDPIESLLQTVDQLQQAYAKACLVDHEELASHQASGTRSWPSARSSAPTRRTCDRSSAEARRRRAVPVDPVVAFRSSGYRARRRPSVRARSRRRTDAPVIAEAERGR